MKKWGANNEYRKLHYWVERQLGKPMVCSYCNDDTRKRYHWANISQEYKKDVSDWVRLCVSCHKTQSHPGKCINGHNKVGDNLYVSPSGIKVCLACSRASNRKYMKTYKKAVAL